MKVKKLEYTGFSGDNYFVCNNQKHEIRYIDYKEWDGFPQYRVDEYYLGVETSKEIAQFETLEEAKNYVQNRWDEYVLSLLEFENENSSEIAQKQQKAKDILLNMAGIMDVDRTDENH